MGYTNQRLEYMKLIYFKGRGIRGYMNHEIHFKESVTFLVGINGSGKTSILKLINGLTKPSYKTLESIEYSYIELSLIHDTRSFIISSTKTKDELSIKCDHVGTNIVINDITPLGGCKEVMEACSRDTDPYPKLYIVDGDIHLMTTPKNPQPHLHILDRYCIENFVIDKESYYKVFNELDSEHEMDVIKGLVSFEDMMDNAIKPMMNLFCHFAVSQDVLGIYRLKHVSQIMKEGIIDNTKLTNEERYVMNDVISNSGISSDIFNKLLTQKLSLYSATSENLQKYVSGKSYLIPYIVEYTKGKLKQNWGITKEGWKYHFSKYCQLEPLSELKNAIIKEVQSMTPSSN